MRTTAGRVSRALKASGTTRRDVVRAYLQYLEVVSLVGLLNGLVRERPELAWLLILDLVRAAKDEQLAGIAAGPLEDLLSYHGPRFIRRVELEARKSRRFRDTLRGTWGHRRMRRDVYRRKERACA